MCAFFSFSLGARGRLFTPSVCYILCVERAVFCDAAQYIVSSGCFPIRGSPCFSSKVQYFVVCVVRLRKSWFLLAVVHLAVYSIFLFVFVLRVDVLKQCGQRFWFFGIYLLRSPNFDIPRFPCAIISYFISVCVYILFGRPVPRYVLLSIISLFCYLYMDYFHFHNGISFGWEVPLYF